MTSRQQEKRGVRVEEILDNLSDAVIKIDSKGNYTYMNRKAEKTLFYNHKDLLPLNNKELYTLAQYHDINGTRLPFEDTPVERVRRGEKFTNHIIIARRDSLIFYYECDGTPLYDREGKLNGGILVYRNISDEFRMEEYRALQENKAGLFLSYASLFYDDFKIKYVNEYGFNEIKKSNTYIKSVFEIIGEDFFNFYQADPALKKAIKRSMKEKKLYYHKQKFIKEGKERYVKSVFQPIFDTNNQVEKVLAIGIDISDEELAKQQMAHTLKLQEEMFTNTSHELKTPLNLIFSATQLLTIQLESDCIDDLKEQVVKSNQIIRQNCYRLTKLVNNILDSAKLESGAYKLNLTNNNIVPIIDDIVCKVSLYTKANGYELIFDPEIEDVEMAIDVDKFERILLNLISNAIKFSGNNRSILIKLALKNSTVEISVQDQGIGMDQEHIESIFDKFVQVDTSLNRICEGAGIGLSLVKSIAELHGGRVWVESSLGEGSIFTIELPITIAHHTNNIKNTHLEMQRAERIKLELSDIYP